MEKEETKNDIDQEWEKRTLCSDESCIGIIGKDGNCKECGLAYDGSLPTQTPVPPADDFPMAPEDVETEPVTETTAATPTEISAPDVTDEGDEWETRTLCADGNCIGVIGTDGRCKECGKPYETE